MNNKIWIDADSCPLLVRNHVIKTGNNLNIPVFLVANKNIPCEENLNYEMIIVEQIKDSADNYILLNSTESDLVITKDIVFADKLVSKNISVINDRGTEFSEKNIKEILSERNYDMALAEIGLVKHFHEGYDKQKFIRFANCFDRVLHRIISGNN
ncbi:MAG: DUF188 domain-containing protein [Treponema sp.]|nr:DUF188 domain-containing protein [Treponema sp.]